MSDLTATPSAAPPQFTVREGESAVYSCDLVDESGAAVPGSSLDSLSLTLYNVHTGLAINSRSNQNVLNVNGVTVSSQGRLTWQMTSADNPLVDRSLRSERHRAVFSWAWPNGTPSRSGVHQVDVVVRRAA